MIVVAVVVVVVVVVLLLSSSVLLLLTPITPITKWCHFVFIHSNLTEVWSATIVIIIAQKGNYMSCRYRVLLICLNGWMLGCGGKKVYTIIVSFFLETRLFHNVRPQLLEVSSLGCAFLFHPRYVFTIFSNVFFYWQSFLF